MKSQALISVARMIIGTSPATGKGSPSQQAVVALFATVRAGPACQNGYRFRHGTDKLFAS